VVLSGSISSAGVPLTEPAAIGKRKSAMEHGTKYANNPIMVIRNMSADWALKHTKSQPTNTYYGFLSCC